MTARHEANQQMRRAAENGGKQPAAMSPDGLKAMFRARASHRIVGEVGTDGR